MGIIVLEHDSFFDAGSKIEKFKELTIVLLVGSEEFVNSIGKENIRPTRINC